MFKTPFVGFSNSTLDKMPSVKAGDMVECQKCGGDHVLEGSGVLLFYRCGGNAYLGAVNGKLTTHIEADVSGEL